MPNTKFPKLSIITVVYNDKNVLKQTYPNLEYIIVDGASTDGTLDVIKKYAGRLRWVSEPDKGIYDAMQKGAKLASGEWILFRNCGDYFINPKVTEDLFNRYDEDKGEDFLLANSRFFKDYGYKDMKPGIINKSFFDAMPVSHPSTFIRRRTQLKYPFHLEYRNSADYCFFVEAFSNGATYRHFDMLVSLFDNETGASSNNYDRSIKENIDFLTKAGASGDRIMQLKQSLKKYKIKRWIKTLMPFYSLYHRWHLKNEGWTQCDIPTILKDI